MSAQGHTQKPTHSHAYLHKQAVIHSPELADYYEILSRWCVKKKLIELASASNMSLGFFVCFLAPSDLI